MALCSLITVFNGKALEESPWKKNKTVFFMVIIYVLFKAVKYETIRDINYGKECISLLFINAMIYI